MLNGGRLNRSTLSGLAKQSRYTSKTGVQEMQSQITDDNSPSYFGWRYPTDGSIRITVEGVLPMPSVMSARETMIQQ